MAKPPASWLSAPGANGSPLLLEHVARRWSWPVLTAKLCCPEGYPSRDRYTVQCHHPPRSPLGHCRSTHLKISRELLTSAELPLTRTKTLNSPHRFSVLIVYMSLGHRWMKTMLLVINKWIWNRIKPTRRLPPLCWLIPGFPACLSVAARNLRAGTLSCSLFCLQIPAQRAAGFNPRLSFEESASLLYSHF